MGDKQTRRNYLQLLGTTGAALFAGCSNDPPTGDGTTTAGPTTTRDGGSAATPTTATESPNPDPSAEFEDVFVELYDQTVGSVVAIRVSGGGLGSGFVYDQNYIVTNYHVVTDANTVEIQYARGQSTTGQVVGTDQYSDLAVVDAAQRPEYANPLTPQPEEPEIGTRVAAIGSPYGLEGSMTNGIVSGVNRLVPSPSANFRIPNAIQTDAPVNPGNSGGPLVNLDGEVLGVVNSGGGENIAFAISAALVERVVPTIIQTGEYNHPYIGVSLAEVTSTVARANNLDRPRGVLVTSVAEGVPAGDVLQGSTGTTRVNGFRVPTGGDIILSVEDQRIDSPRDLLTYLELNASPGETVQFTILRNGQRRTVSVELIARERVQ